MSAPCPRAALARLLLAVALLIGVLVPGRAVAAGPVIPAGKEQVVLELLAPHELGAYAGAVDHAARFRRMAMRRLDGEPAPRWESVVVSEESRGDDGGLPDAVRAVLDDPRSACSSTRGCPATRCSPRPPAPSSHCARS